MSGLPRDAIWALHVAVHGVLSARVVGRIETYVDPERGMRVLGDTDDLRDVVRRYPELVDWVPGVDHIDEVDVDGLLALHAATASAVGGALPLPLPPP